LISSSPEAEDNMGFISWNQLEMILHQARAMASKASPRTVTMSVNQYAWCPSRFSSEHDLELRLKSFGEEEATHKINWERHLKHRYGYSQDD
jgi:hypothetical protein